MKIEEELDNLVRDYFKPHSDIGFPWDDFIQTVKQYAEYYAKRCLQIAAENATGRFQTDANNCEYIEINTESITGITLPEHEL